MSNLRNKPKRTSKEIIEHMKDKGITFNEISEKDAEEFLLCKNNFMRTGAYRVNYNKRTDNHKYMCLDFAYLIELSKIDTELRFIVNKLCCAVENAIKVEILKDMETNDYEDGYEIVTDFILENKNVLDSVSKKAHSFYTLGLVEKYFTEERNRYSSGLSLPKDCPVWVLFEMLSFGDILRFYKFYYPGTDKNCKPEDRDPDHLPVNVLNLIRELRNATAHGNCLLINLSDKNSKAPFPISRSVTQIENISYRTRQEKLSNTFILELVALLFAYKEIVSSSKDDELICEFNNLLKVRIPEHSEYFVKNSKLTSTYEFICKVFDSYFKI